MAEYTVLPSGSMIEVAFGKRYRVLPDGSMLQGLPGDYLHIEHRETSVGGAWARNSVGDEASTYTIRGLTPNTQYDVRVFQENSVGESLASTTATPTTPEQAAQADLMMMDWAEPFFFSLPPFGVGAFTDLDGAQILGLPTVAFPAINGAYGMGSLRRRRRR